MWSHRIQRRQRGHAQRSKKQRATKIIKKCLGTPFWGVERGGIAGWGCAAALQIPCKAWAWQTRQRSVWRGICSRKHPKHLITDYRKVGQGLKPRQGTPPRFKGAPACGNYRTSLLEQRAQPYICRRLSTGNSSHYCSKAETVRTIAGAMPKALHQTFKERL